MGRVMGGFQNQVAWQLTGRLLLQQVYGKCEYTLAEAERAEVVFEAMEAYIQIIQSLVAHYISTQSLLDLCRGKNRTQGARVGMRWWE